MKVAFDAKRLFHNHTGLGNYSRNLLFGLEKQHPEHTYILIDNNIEKSQYKDQFEQHKLIMPSTILPSLYRSLGQHKIINKVKPNIYHGLSNELPVFNKLISASTVVSIHDLFYERYPKDFSFTDRSIYKYKTKHAADTSDHIIAISESTKKDIIKYLNVDESKISVVYQTCHPIFQSEHYVYSGNIQQLPKEYMIQVGSINKRKNLIGIIKAMEILPSSSRLPLVIVGEDSGSYAKEIKQYISKKNLESEVLFLGQLDNPTLKWLYSRATFSTFASHYEGFGIPVIESLFCGSPVLTSKNSSLPEAVGPCGFLADPNDIGEISHGIAKLTEDSDYRNTLINAIPKHIKQFTLAETADKMMSLYQQLI